MGSPAEREIRGEAREEVEFRDDGVGTGQRPQRLKYQSGVLDRFEQIRMTDVEYTAGTEGSRVFVTSREDYRQGDGTPYKNVYVFRFVLRGGLIVVSTSTLTR